jgi:type I restriction enzyme S subunit
VTDLPQGWKWAALEDLAASDPRAITDGPFGSNLKSSHYVDSGPRVIRLQNIGFGEFIDEIACISAEHFETLRAHEACGDDLIVASLGEDLPRSCLIPASVGAAIVKADCIRVRLHPEISPQYVNLALQRPALRDAVRDQIHGVGRPRLGMKGIKALSVPLAPLSEQRRIVAAIEEHLSRLDAAAASIRSAAKRVEAFRQRLIDSLPEGALVPLRDLLREPPRNGISAPASASGTVRVVTLTAVTRAAFIERNTKLIEQPVRSLDDLWMEPGDIFIQRSNTPELVGTAAMYRGERAWAIFPDLLIRVRPNERADPAYLELVLRSTAVRRYFQRSAQGIAGSMPKVSQPIVEGAPIPLPSRERQVQLVHDCEAHVTAVDRLSAALDAARRRAVQLRRSILAGAFAGQIVPQDSGDEPASVLLERIRAERTAAGHPKRARKVTSA